MVERLVDYSDSSDEEQESHVFRHQQSAIPMTNRNNFHSSASQYFNTSFSSLNTRKIVQNKRFSFPLSPTSMDIEYDIDTSNTISRPYFKRVNPTEQGQPDYDPNYRRVLIPQKDLHRAAKRRGNVSYHINTKTQEKDAALPSPKRQDGNILDDPLSSPMDVEYDANKAFEKAESPGPWKPSAVEEDQPENVQEDEIVSTDIFNRTNRIRRRMSTGSKIRFHPARKSSTKSTINVPKPIPETTPSVEEQPKNIPFTFKTTFSTVESSINDKKEKPTTNVFVFGATAKTEAIQHKSDAWTPTASFSIGRTIPSSSSRSRRPRRIHTKTNTTSTAGTTVSDFLQGSLKTFKTAAKSLFQTREEHGTTNESTKPMDATSVFGKLDKEQSQAAVFFPFQRVSKYSNEEKSTDPVETNVFASKSEDQEVLNDVKPTSPRTEPERSPPVEVLKSSFDIFGIAKIKQNTTPETTSPNPFEWKSTKPRRKEYHGQTPPADPFVTPVYSRTSKTRTERSRGKEKAKQCFSIDMTNTPPPPSSIFDRRVVHAIRPKDASHDDDKDGSEEENCGWGYWKERASEAYTMRLFEDAAEYYRRSLDAMETLYTTRPSRKTESLLLDRAKLHANRAASLMMVWQLTKAQEECLQAIAIDGLYVRAYVRLCRIYVLRGDVDNAKATQAKCVQLLGSNHQETKDLERIELGIHKLIRLQGDLQWNLDVGDDDRVVSIIHEALVIAPCSRTLQLQKAQALFRQKKYTEIELFCRSTIQKTRRSSTLDDTEDEMYQREATCLGIELSLVRIQALHYHNQMDEAMCHLNALEQVTFCHERLIELKKKLMDMKELKQNANHWFKIQDYEQAFHVYSQALLIDPNHDAYCAVIYCNRAAALMGLKRYDSAIRDCIAALNRRTHYLKAYLRRARCYVAIKRYVLALVDFDVYLRDDHLSNQEREEITLERLHTQVAMDKDIEENKRREAAQRRKERQQREKQKKERPPHRPSWNEPNNGRWGNPRASSINVKTVRKSSHYQLLGVSKYASQDEIKKAYRKLALLHHPDKAKSIKQAELFKDMTAAYHVLSDVTTRQAYDREQILI